MRGSYKSLHPVFVRHDLNVATRAFKQRVKELSVKGTGDLCCRDQPMRARHRGETAPWPVVERSFILYYMYAYIYIYIIQIFVVT